MRPPAFEADALPTEPPSAVKYDIMIETVCVMSMFFVYKAVYFIQNFTATI